MRRENGLVRGVMANLGACSVFITVSSLDKVDKIRASDPHPGENVNSLIPRAVDLDNRSLNFSAKDIVSQNLCMGI